MSESVTVTVIEEVLEDGSYLTSRFPIAPGESDRLVAEALAKLSDAEIMQRAAAVFDAYDETDVAGCRAALLRAFAAALSKEPT